MTTSSPRRRPGSVALLSGGHANTLLDMVMLFIIWLNNFCMGKGTNRLCLSDLLLYRYILMGRKTTIADVKSKKILFFRHLPIRLGCAPPNVFYVFT